MRWRAARHRAARPRVVRPPAAARRPDGAVGRAARPRLRRDRRVARPLSLLADAVAARAEAGTPECAVVLVLDPSSAAPTTVGAARASSTDRRRRSPRAGRALSSATRPPSTAAQLGWVGDRDCAVEVSVPTPLAAADACDGANAAAGRAVEDSHECGHLEIEARAATASGGDCALSVNGLDLFKAAASTTLSSAVMACARRCSTRGRGGRWRHGRRA